MKEEILRLHKEGKSYTQIQKVLNCAKSTISWHLNNLPETRMRVRLTGRIQKFQKKTVVKSKKSFTLAEFLEKFGSRPRCYLTGKVLKLEEENSYELDHIIPVSKGGNGGLENLAICTREANQAKRDLLLEEFLILCKNVLENHNFVVLEKGEKHGS